MALEEKTVIIGGQARLPKELYPEGVFQVVAEIEMESGKIRDVDFSPASPVVLNKLKSWLTGISIPEDLPGVLDKIEQRFFHKAKKAVLTAVKDLGREFREIQNRNPLQNSPES